MPAQVSLSLADLWHLPVSEFDDAELLEAREQLVDQHEDERSNPDIIRRLNEVRNEMEDRDDA